MLKEFRDFAFKGNLLDVGIGFVIGGATAAFVGAFTSNLVTPWLGLAGGANMANLFAIIKPGKTGGPYPTQAAAAADGAVVLTYGAFLDEFIKFLLIMFVMFLIVRTINKFKKEEEAAPAAPSDEVVLLGEIRDLLKK